MEQNTATPSGGGQPGDETTERVTGWRIVHRTRTYRGGQSITRSGDVSTLLDVASALDRARLDDVDATGSEGNIGNAGTWVEIVFDDDDPEDEDTDGERIDDLTHPALATLPLGAVSDARRETSEYNREECWDGNNHVIPGAYYTQEVLDRIRGRR